MYFSTRHICIYVHTRSRNSACKYSRRHDRTRCEKLEDGAVIPTEWNDISKRSFLLFFLLFSLFKNIRPFSDISRKKKEKEKQNPFQSRHYFSQWRRPYINGWKVNVSKLYRP